MDRLHTANKVCGGCCAISLNTVDTESSVSPMSILFQLKINIFTTEKYFELYVCVFIIFKTENGLKALFKIWLSPSIIITKTCPCNIQRFLKL